METGWFPVGPDAPRPDPSPPRTDPRAVGGDPSHPARPDGEGPVPWWEDGRGWGEGDGFDPFPRRRRSPILRVAGLLVVVALVFGTAGTTLEIVLGSRQRPELPVSGVTTTGHTRIAFTVTNDTATTVLPECTVELLAGTSKIGSLPVPARSIGPLAAGTAATGSLLLPTRLAALAARSTVRVICAA